MNEFEKWWVSKSPLYRPKDIEELELYAKTAYLAGAAAMREKCAEVADNEANGFRNTRIAAAIRKIGVE